MKGALAAALRDGVAALGLELNAGVEGQLLAYLDLLNRWNRVHNLTAIRDPAQQLSHHLLDCLSVLAHLPPGPLADIGSGAGLPGLIIALAEPQRPVYLVESSKKKCAFLPTAVAALGLKAVHIVAQRVEDWPGPVAVIISRALAELRARADAETAVAGAAGAAGAASARASRQALLSCESRLKYRDKPEKRMKSE